MSPGAARRAGRFGDVCRRDRGALDEGRRSPGAAGARSVTSLRQHARGMPTVAIDTRGAGQWGRLLVAELRRFAGLSAPAWRPWLRVVAPHTRAAPRGGAPAGGGGSGGL